MRRMGFDLYLDEAVQAPIIATFRSPEGFGFRRFYDALAERGFLIYPGKLTQAESFRIGCIGRLSAKDMHGALAAIREALAEMDVRLAPAKAA